VGGASLKSEDFLAICRAAPALYSPTVNSQKEQ